MSLKGLEKFAGLAHSALYFRLERKYNFKMRVILMIVLVAVYSVGQQPVSLPTADGGVVFADVFGAGERGVVLAHGGRFNKESWAKQVPAFVSAGFRVVAIDFRGRGQSKGGTELKPGDEGLRYDVLAAVLYLREHGTKRISLVGGSMGGTAAAEAAVEAKAGEIESVVIIAAEGGEHPEKMMGRTLYITARDDIGPGNVPRLPGIRANFDKARQPKEFVLLEGSAHAQFLFETEQGERLLREILRFLAAK